MSYFDQGPRVPGAIADDFSSQDPAHVVPCIVQLYEHLCNFLCRGKLVTGTVVTGTEFVGC